MKKLTNGNKATFFSKIKAGEIFSYSETTMLLTDVMTLAKEAKFLLRGSTNGEFQVTPMNKAVTMYPEGSRQLFRASTRAKPLRPVEEMILLKPTRAMLNARIGQERKLKVAPIRKECEGRVKGLPWKHETERRAKLKELNR